jgi:lactobin A/cerein 7B family class IIb bacteriocin
MLEMREVSAAELAEVEGGVVALVIIAAAVFLSVCVGIAKAEHVDDKSALGD